MKNKNPTRSELVQMIHDLCVIVGVCQMILDKMRDEGTVSDAVVKEHYEYICFMLERATLDLDIPRASAKH